MRRSCLLAVTFVVAVAAVGQAAVLCAPRRHDGAFNSGVKIREQCQPREVRLGILQLDPLVVGEPPPSSSTTSTTTSTTVLPSTVTTTSVSPSCGNGVVEAGEVCDCPAGLRGINGCQPDPFATMAFDSGGCPTGPDGRPQWCTSDCTTCVPAPRCGDRTYDPGDECDYGSGTGADNCFPPAYCLGFDGTRCFCIGGPTTSTIP